MTKNLSNLNTGDHRPLELKELLKTAKKARPVAQAARAPATAPGEYKTRLGRKAEVFAIRNGKLIGYSCGKTMEWNPDGSRWPEGESQFDLVGPWKEPVTVEAWVDVLPGRIAPSDLFKFDVRRIDCRKLRYVEGKGITDITEEKP